MEQPSKSSSGSSTASEPIAKQQKTASPRYKLVIDDEDIQKLVEAEGLPQAGGQGIVFAGKSVADPLKEVAVKVFYVGMEAAARKEAVRRPIERPPHRVPLTTLHARRRCWSR